MAKNISIDLIKKLREETAAPVMEVKKALDNAGGNLEKARMELKKWVAERAAKKQDEETFQGIVEAYIHSGGKVGALIILTCQTDFVAINDSFKKLAHEIAMQVASMNPKDEAELLEQSYIRDPKVKIKDLITEKIAKLGENIKVKKFTRFSL